MSKIKLYSLATPNGMKASIALEEMGLPYEAHKIDITKDEQFQDFFVELNPNSKIPVIVDPDGPSGEEHTVFESGAILLYLSEKTGKFLPQDPAMRSETIQWLFFQMASVGPMFGQFGHFYKYAKDKCDHPYPVKRYTDEVKRLLKVIDNRLQKTKYLAHDELSIADFATMPWVHGLEKFYHAKDELKLESYTAVADWKAAILDRPAVQKGMKVCEF